MPMKPNLEYWNLSLAHPEITSENVYSRDEIIVQDSNYLEAVNRLREHITAYCVLQELGESKETRRRVVIAIDALLRSVDKIQYTEFVAYWKCLDLTFSVYRKIFDDSQRHTLLENALENYCEQRRRLYDRLGYTPVIQQALYDSAKARSQGVSGVQKLQQILQRAMSKEVPTVSCLKDFVSCQLCQFVPSSNKQELFREIMQSLHAKYEFGAMYQKKIPDLMVKVREKVFVIEAKHIKESGGAQDKQIAELISYIRQKEDRKSPVRYIAFLDGLYFNLLAGAKEDTKLAHQRQDIENALRENTRNYFVNTVGLLHLLQDAYQRRSRANPSDAATPP
ncbi:MAG: hypothetical protein KatS3mg020_0105 [Fimbriimonadales bacterium]|nr:MAG: hypothetical protein KatS3mg020_0105 [Fimbriimonadales bacterium]